MHVQRPAYYSDRLWCTLHPHSGSEPFQLITFNAPPSVSTRIPNSRLVCLILQCLKSPYAWWTVNFNLQTLKGTISSHYLSLKPHNPFIFFFWWCCFPMHPVIQVRMSVISFYLPISRSFPSPTFRTWRDNFILPFYLSPPAVLCLWALLCPVPSSAWGQASGEDWLLATLLLLVWFPQVTSLLVSESLFCNENLILSFLCKKSSVVQECPKLKSKLL